MQTCRLIFAVLAVAGLVLPAALNFARRDLSGPVVRQEKTMVKAASILVYFMACCALAGFGIGEVSCGGTGSFWCVGVGAALIVAGTALNCVGRIQLGHNWSDENTIYARHSLVRQGVFAKVRHPLFSAIIGLSGGLGLLFSNGVILAATLFLLVPALYKRARNEERLLANHFPEYRHYADSVPMFVPSIGRPRGSHSG